MEDNSELLEPPFETWFRNLVSLARDKGHSIELVAYKGMWVDAFSEGYTPEEALTKRFNN
ncbi:TPA: hypothetical protein ACWME0_001068 [Klebsiella pneumoniae]|uniref:hypothetical protein n=1 Tax=Klebsiella pneumoniae TaxID=573 RepID=UPI002152EFD4|nr:hypothetical protein [Klebsiella pneumoniae]